MKKKLSFFLAFLMILSMAGCTAGQPEAPPHVSKSNFMLDTYIEITLYDWTDASTIDLAFDEIRRLESLLSVEQTGSDLDRLAKAAGEEWVEISPETEEVLRLSKEYAALSEGYFDVTTGPLVSLWNIHNEQGHYPSQAELEQVLPLIDSDDLLVKEGQVKELLVAQGVEHAVLNLGRNILLIGDKQEGTAFTIGIQDPNEEEGVLADVVSATGKSIVTSGIDERYFTYQGKKYHHILDPYTGFPADTGLASVTILSDTSAQGDALSTTCFLLGIEKGMALVEQLDDVEALFITTEGELIPSSGYSNYQVQQ